jgi:hypothetical protein
MKFNTKCVLLLTVVFIFLAIFLHYVNRITEEYAKEEAEQMNAMYKQAFEGFEAYNGGDRDGLVSKDYDETRCPNLLVHRGDILLLYNTRARNSDEALVKTFQNVDEYHAWSVQEAQEGRVCPVVYMRQEVNTQGQDVFRMYSDFSQQAYYNGIRDIQSRDHPGSGAGSPTAPRPPISLDSAVHPPPFYEMYPNWDFHNKPPFFVEGGLPTLPAESKEAVIKDAIRVHPAPPLGVTPDPKKFAEFDPYRLNMGNFTDQELMEAAQAAGQEAAGSNGAAGIHDDKVNLSANAYDTNWGGVMFTQATIDSGKFQGNQVNPVIYPHMGIV